MTQESITAALHNLQAQINEIVGLMKDCAKQPTTMETASNLVGYSIKLSQLEGAFNTLQQYAPTLALVSENYPIPPAQPTVTEEEEDEEEEPLIITEGVSQTFDRVAKIHADTAAARAEEAEE
tara:strand:- start:879 stop:1247 length:369 start_codon:yes stop_codon:yes gene_type:complete